MGKRKEDQRSDDSSSSSSSSSFDAKRRRPRRYRNGETSRQNDGTLTLIELRDAIQQDKVIMEANFNRKIKKLKEKRKRDKEDIRILQEGQEYLKSQIQEMQKGGCAKLDHERASPSQRSQLSQSTRYRLVIESSILKTIYKRETIETKDGGGHIKVIMYDGDNPIAPDNPLASVKVDLVVIEGGFNEPKRYSWSKEEFEKSIITKRDGMVRLVENGTFDLIGGRCDHQGAIIMDNSQKKEVKLGVRIAVHKEERVLEGVSNPFRVQEGKTKRAQKKGKQPSPPGPKPILVQPTSTHATQHDNGNYTKFPTNGTAEDNRLSYPPATLPRTVEGNGQALNGNGQSLSQEILAQILGQSTSGYSMQHGQGYSWAPPSIQNQQAAGYCPVNQSLLARGQDQYTSLPNGSSELAYHTPSNYELLNGIQSTFIPEDVHYLNAQAQMQETYETFKIGRVLLQCDNPHVELRERWNFLDQLMPLYSTKSRFYGESFPSTSLMDKTHKLLGSISSVGSVWKKMTSDTPQKRGVLIRPIEPYDSDDESPVKKQRNAKYQLRFVNRVCSDYYTQEQIKSEDGTFLKIALYDENNLVVTSGPLSSVSVEVVLLHGDFNAEGQYYWTPEEFSTCLVHPQSAKEPPALGGDRVLALTDGEADLGNVNFQTSSFHARTGKFKMGVVSANVREESVQEGITSPFVVRVRLGEEPSRHQITSLEALLRVGMKLPNQVCGALEEHDAKENVGASLAVHDQSSSTASDRPPELPSSKVISVLGASTASDLPPEQTYESELALTLPKLSMGVRKSAKRGDSIWGAWFFFTHYFRPVIAEKPKGKVTLDASVDISGFHKSDLRRDVFMVQHVMENLYMWVFKERPDNALGMMQLRSFINGNSRLGEPFFPFSVDKGFTRSYGMHRKQYRGLPGPQCLDGIEFVNSPSLEGVPEADVKRWAELTGRGLNFSIPAEASDFRSWRFLPITDLELDRPQSQTLSKSVNQPSQVDLPRWLER